ncbi:MAG TPA: hypothetical protein VK168_04960 [Saprospiraceae bacterium]|nr:hypothetical protein [Saprospiraceae bacterium]
MKKLFFATLVLFVFLCNACKDQRDEEVETIMVRFQNQLSQDITEAYYDFDPAHQTTIGLIPAGGTTDYIEFSYFQVGDGIPMGLLRGKKAGEDFSAWAGLWCATGVTFYQLEPGKYTIEILDEDVFLANAYMRLK